MNLYHITCSALGYSTSTLAVVVPDIVSARQLIPKAKKLWAEENDVDYSTSGLCFVAVELSHKDFVTTQPNPNAGIVQPFPAGRWNSKGEVNR